MTDMKIVVGGTMKDDATAFLAAWHRAEAGDTTTERVLAHVMTGERYRLLRHLHARPAVSVSALAWGLGRRNRAITAPQVQPSTPYLRLARTTGLGMDRTMPNLAPRTDWRRGLPPFGVGNDARPIGTWPTDAPRGDPTPSPPPKRTGPFPPTQNPLHREDTPNPVSLAACQVHGWDYLGLGPPQNPL